MQEHENPAHSLDEHWTKILNDWKMSGLNIAAYCRKIETPTWKFHYWKKRLLGAKKKPTGDFVKVKFSGPAGHDSGLSIEIPGGLFLKLECGFDEHELSRALKILSGRKC